MPRITISYRREDSGAITGRIFDRLVGHYGRGAIFRDIDNIPLGVDFREHVGHALGSSDIVLAIIGPRWVGARESGNRLSDNADPVRLEIEAALQKSIPLIPVLVLGATMPQVDDLPESLKNLAYRNAIEIDTGQDFDVHISRLIRAMDDMLRLPAQDAVPDDAAHYRARSRPVWLPVTIVAAMIVMFGAVAGGWYMGTRRPDERPKPDSTTSASSQAARTAPTPPKVPAANDQAVTPAPPSVDAETVFWQSVAASNDAADFKEYLSKYPNGRFAGLARNRVAALTPPLDSRAACGTSDEQIMQPVEQLYRAVDTKNIELYAAQWSDDGHYVDLRTGVTQTKAEKIEERRNRFTQWESVNLAMDRSMVVQRTAEHATIEVTYSMTIKPYGRPPLKQTGVSERYELVCGSGGRWLIGANLDENR
jgi:hypothetical protein